MNHHYQASQAEFNIDQDTITELSHNEFFGTFTFYLSHLGMQYSKLLDCLTLFWPHPFGR